MKNAFLLFVSTFITATLAGCDLTNNMPEEADCTPPTTLVAQAPCESGYAGVLLIASGYKGDRPMQFIYSIFPQKDTLSNDVTKSAYANASDERILISETVLKDAPKFVVQATVNCTGKDRPSMYFSFVKRPSANSACYVWARQK